MTYTEINIKSYKPKGGKRNKRDENLMYRIEFKGTEPDRTGLGGTWECGGTLYNIYRCQQYMVALNLVTMTPVFIAENIPDLIDQLQEITRCSNIIRT